jgi:DNA-binding NtrC family response regulator
MQGSVGMELLSAQSWSGSGTVLVVDDEEVVRESLREMLELMGFIAWLAVDGDQAFSTWKSTQGRLRAMILDWNMPGMSGVEVFEKIREVDPDMPIILTSAYKPDDQIIGLRAQGNLIFLRKPFTMSALRHALKQQLEQHQSA